MKYQRVIFLVGILSLLLSACNGAPAQTTTAAPAATPAPELANLKIVVLPILDTLPMYVAQQEGLFTKQGVQVEFLAAGSAAERDQMIAAGQADGLINDALSTILYDKDGVQVQIVRYARVSTTDFPEFYLLASKQSGIQTVDGLKGIEIGISQGTVIDYVTHRLLQAEGFNKTDILTIAVPKVADRLSLLVSGQLKAAMMPDPLSLLAIQQGAVLVLPDSKHPSYGFSTIAMRKNVLDAQPQAVRGFLAAIEQATTDINQQPSRWSGLLSEQKLVPASLAGSYPLPMYPKAGVPSEAQWQDVLSWAKEQGLVSNDVPYTDAVNPAFLTPAP